MGAEGQLSRSRHLRGAIALASRLPAEELDLRASEHTPIVVARAFTLWERTRTVWSGSSPV